MVSWSPEQVAKAAGARLLVPGSAKGPESAVIDSRKAGPGALFVGLPGNRADGGEFAARALASGAWGVLVNLAHAERLGQVQGAVIAADEPLQALQRLATAWRRHLGARTIGVTGSTGKTTTKEMIQAILAPHLHTVASRANFNTEIGLPLEILGAPGGTEVLVLEMAMRGTGQIAELARIAQPDVGVIINIGPAHLEQLGTIEAVAAAKAELLTELAPGATAVLPEGEPLLQPHLRADLRTITFGDSGDVRLVAADGEHLKIDVAGEQLELEVGFTQTHLRLNLLAAVGAAHAIGVTPQGRIELPASPGRGQRSRLPQGVLVIDDCYNANPMSMRAAIDDLVASAEHEQSARTVAVLGDMLELGPAERDFHVDIGRHAAEAGVDVVVAVGPLARAAAEAFGGEAHCIADAAEAATVVPDLISPGDVVLIKASRGVGLERVCQALHAGALA